MTIASTIINDALQWIGVSSVIMPAEPDQQNRAFKTLQRLYAILPTQNVYLQMQRPASVGVNLREPEYATEALVHILGKTAAPYFQASLTPDHYELYKDSMNLLRRKTGRRAIAKYGSDVPIGSGNAQNYADWAHYYLGDNQYQFTLFDEAKEGESKLYPLDFNERATYGNTSLSSVVWSNIGAESATISEEAVSGNIATARLNYPSAGPVIVRARATFANGDIYDGIIQVRVVDPQSAYLGADHG